MDNTYFKRIIYKMNAFEDLKTYIKINFSNKKILLVSDNKVLTEEHTLVLNSIICGSGSVGHFVSRENFCERELELFKNKIISGKYDLLISLGGERVCESVKYFACIFNMPYIVCPTEINTLSYFLSYCINPYNKNESLCGKFPNKIFIQESIIRSSDLCTNIDGLCYLNALRCIYVQGIIDGNVEDKHLFVGLEKLFLKLDEEETNILLCSEDSNLVLMDLFIDFGFFVESLDKDEFYLFRMYQLYGAMTKIHSNSSGREFLLCAKIIMSVLQEYFKLGNVQMIEKPNFQNMAKIINNYKINGKKLKNNAFLNEFLNNVSLRLTFKEDFSEYYNLVFGQMYKIKSFCKKVKSVYKRGIEIEGENEKLLYSLALAPYIDGGGRLSNFLAASGLLNAFVSV